MPAAQFVWGDPEGGGDGVGQYRGRIVIDRTAAEKKRRSSRGGGCEFAQPGALDRPDQFVALGFQRPILLCHRFARAVGQNDAAQGDSIRGFLHRVRRTVAALEAAARLIGRKRQRLRPPFHHPSLPRRALGREQRMGFERAVRPAERERFQGRPFRVDLDLSEFSFQTDRFGHRFGLETGRVGHHPPVLTQDLHTELPSNLGGNLAGIFRPGYQRVINSGPDDGDLGHIPGVGAAVEENGELPICGEFRLAGSHGRGKNIGGVYLWRDVQIAVGEGTRGQCQHPALQGFPRSGRSLNHLSPARNRPPLRSILKIRIG